MKIRTGFVSNSSTTSFTIAGVYVSEYSIIKDEDFKNYLIKTVDWITEEEWRGNTSECIRKGLEEITGKLDNYRDPYAGGSYIGINIEKMNEEETLGGFLERASVLLREIHLLTDSQRAELITDGWRDD